ncbi:MAG: putative rane-bound dehydrogenase [Chthoniobacteraceae bacterium]|nr:putative rane-bound dehydrogenase [Chthoniobacteraceae bacterium]
MIRTTLLVFTLIFLTAPLRSAEHPANRLAYLDDDNPFYPHAGLARFTTPQWIGEPGVDAAVIISIDDLRETPKYEAYLRPILQRLQQIDGRAPTSIFCNQLVPTDPQFQSWLKEGVSLEVHTLTHPCPLLGKTGFSAAQQTVFGGIDQLASIPGNLPLAFRMPCCDSMNSASPRFFSEIFSGRSPEGRHLQIDSSVMCLLTSGDTTLPHELVVDASGADRFRKYFPMDLVPPRKVTFERFAGYIENYPYPYVIGGGCWEFPPMAPSDWEAFNTHGAKNQRTTEDWKAALDAVVLKQGVMTILVHPHGWSDPQQIVALIEHAVAKYGRRVKFLNFTEALGRLEKHALAGHSLRARDGGPGSVRLLDFNGDGFMDVLAGQVARLWSPQETRWVDSPAPFKASPDLNFGVIDGEPVALRAGAPAQGWRFHESHWIAAPELAVGIPSHSSLRLRDFNGDASCELLANEPELTVIQTWSAAAKRWERAEFALPEGIAALDKDGADAGLRFVDLNADGADDLLLSNTSRFAIHLWSKEVKPNLGWTSGWSQMVRAGLRQGMANEPPPIVRDGRHRNNGAWFKDGHLVVQNEETVKLDGVVDRRSFQELIAFDVPAPKSPGDSLAAIRVRAGFKVELVAAEPLVIDPIAFEWDSIGRLWVVEMRDYPLGMDGKGKAGGVIKLLEDTNGDGIYDKATPFMEGLPFPSGVMPYRNGLLICAAPDILYAEDTDGDGHADVRRVLFTGFKQGNQQHRLNGFEWGLDGWIYGANGDSGGEVQCVGSLQTKPDKQSTPVSISGRDFRFRPDTGEFEAVSGSTQFGRRRDDWGHWFGNNNSTWLWHYTLEEHYLRRNPKLAVKSVRELLANYEESTRVFPISEQPIRFNQPQSLGHVTSACSAAPYRDDLFGPDFLTSVFISEPVHNSVHREVLKAEGATFTSRRADDEQDREFLASSDVWFRPAMVKTGPDGALYIADMYRFVLEHPEWIAPETQARLDLRAGQDKGRIYRVLPEKALLKPVPNLAKLNTAQLVRAMESANGWQRDTVQRLLYERADSAAAEPLAKLASGSSLAKVRLQALATLELLHSAKTDAIVAALRDQEPEVRIQALRISEKNKSETLLAAAIALENDANFAVRLQLAFTLGESKTASATEALKRLAQREGGDPRMRVAVLSSIGPDNSLMAELTEGKKPGTTPASPVPKLAPSSPDRARVVASYSGVEKLRADPSRGRTFYTQICATCHRLHGEGRELGPDLGTIVGKPDDWILTALFDPNQAIEARYIAQHLILNNGNELVGLLVGETGNNITLRTPEGVEQAVLRSELRSIKPLGRSLMPEGLESVLKPQDVADLLGYLRKP